MIHQYINNDYYIVMDVNSGSVHVVDPMLYDMIGLLSEKIDNLTEPVTVPEEAKEYVGSLFRYSGADRYGTALYGRRLQGLCN